LSVLPVIGNFLLLCLTFQGLVLSVILFYSSKKIKSNKWLAAVIFLLSYSTLTAVILNSGIPNKYPWVYFVIPQLRLALGPLLYFYTRSLLSEKQQLSRKDRFHFAPLLFEMGPQVAFIFHFFRLLSVPAIRSWYQPFETWVMNFEAGSSATLPFFFSFLIYLGLSLKMVRSADNQQLSGFKLKDVRWLKTLIVVLFLIVAIWLITIILNYLPVPQLVYPVRFVMALLAIGFAYWLGMAAYARQAKMSVDDLVEYHKIPAKAYFAEDEIERYQTQLLGLMETDRLYLNPALKLDVLSAKMALPEKQLSNLLNQHLGKSFNDFINEYRVMEARKKLADASLSKFTIAAIAFDCGFNSLATFQRCFKQFTGVTPSGYQKDLNVTLSPVK
jgi:AraC-like DNA-binding protein